MTFQIRRSDFNPTTPAASTSDVGLKPDLHGE